MATNDDDDSGGSAPKVKPGSLPPTSSALKATAGRDNVLVK